MTFYSLGSHFGLAFTALFSTGLSPTSHLASSVQNVATASLPYTPHSMAFLEALDNVYNSSQ